MFFSRHGEETLESVHSLFVGDWPAGLEMEVKITDDSTIETGLREVGCKPYTEDIEGFLVLGMSLRIAFLDWLKVLLLK